MNQAKPTVKNDATMPVVAIMTRHNVQNYGSVMQTYATERILRELGCCPVTVDYRRTAETADGLIKQYSANKSLPYRVYRRTVWLALHGIGERRFGTMRKDYLTLSSPCDEATIWERIPDAGIYLTGSDQVWNGLENGEVDGAFFWEGIEPGPGRKIVSYAASFGRDKVTPGYEEKVGKLLSRYDAISVREDSGVDIVKGYGLEVEQVLDPTLLLEGDDWRTLASPAKAPSRPYALVYNLHPDSEMLGYVAEKARDSKLEIVSVCASFRRRIGKHVILPTLPEFLGLFARASCVYTDSFHGTALCINLGVPFVAVFPKANAARNKSALRLFGLEGRGWDVFDGNAWDDDIDWGHVRSVLAAERKRSTAWLASALEVEAVC